MSSPNLNFKCALITGGGGGLGKAFAQYFLSLGKKVIIVGRTESKLKETAEELGKGTTYYVQDTGKIDELAGFASKVIKEHPEVDCIVNNAGVQRPLNIQDFDLEKADQEIDINIRGPIRIVVAFLDHLKSKPDGGVILNVTSVLGYCPFRIINPDYNGTKAFMHFWTMAVRTQLKDTKIRVIECVPPSVETELHRDIKDKEKDKNPDALSVDDFMKEVRQYMEEGKTTFSAGPGVAIVDEWYQAFGGKYEQAASKWEGYSE